ncbi:hypothetical protein QGN29_02480 [Temperatibacter marinus]|uniref:EF-hand domain-containing protein n=1 Tax=Temperatibacter marinus TaxID=1456591 RepID=A0AA52H9T0_9PROT|nr:hypothetical protein [Temperatibacter marinus]WND03234.1 hypothetical protein QGN29_02480 [Temperatibacter marinus]
MTNKLFLVLCLSTFLLSACTSGPGRPDRGAHSNRKEMSAEKYEKMKMKFRQKYETIISNLDLNKDGFLTCEDDYIQKANLFKKLDTDASYDLSSSEYREVNFMTNKYMFHDFSTVDKNHSRSITLKEFQAIPNGYIIKYDRNNDCTATEEEVMKVLMKELRSSGSKERGQRSQGKRSEGKRRSQRQRN